MRSPLRLPGRKGGLGRSLASLAGAVVIGLLTVDMSVAGAGILPPLGSALNPGTGVWGSAADGKLPVDQTLTLPGLSGAATVGFEADGTAHITGKTDADMFRALGYTQARFRLFQMDLARRQAEGRLSEVLVLQDAWTSDAFELDLGLNRAAQRDWDTLPADSPARATLTEYTEGVNAAIKQMTKDDSLPLYYKLLDFSPEPWTPVDSLAVQRLETQTLAFDILPTAYSHIARGFGVEKFDAMYKTVAQNPQFPYDPGPYKSLPLDPLPAPDSADPAPTVSPAALQTPAPTPAAPDPGASDQALLASDQLLNRFSQLPNNAFHTIGDSNTWVVSGSKTASGKPIMAGDPHLGLTVPAIWYQVELTSPGYHLAGVTVPGIPAVLIGKNDRISWSLTNSQRPGTLYYLEQTDAAHPDQYFWNGAWRPMTKIPYSIKKKDGSTEQHIVRLTVHGPIVTLQGVTAAVWQTSTLPSDNLDAMLKVEKATSFDQFHEALRGWVTPAQNFSYADAAGNIGIVNAGVQPQVKSGRPYLPMAGTGESDVVGTIPFDALPITYNPPEGFASTANEREVTADYPYYYGKGFDFFDQGWRQDELHRVLSTSTGITAADMEKLQLSEADPLARMMVPVLLKALDGQQLDPEAAKALDALRAWDGDVTADSVGATVFLRFWVLYGYEVWHPVWTNDNVPAPPRDVFTPRKNDGTYAVDALAGLLINTTTNDPGNALFAADGVNTGGAPALMRKAFTEAVADLQAKRGADVAGWTYGGTHKVLIASLLQSVALDEGPYPTSGSGRTINSVVSAAPVRNGKTLTGVAIAGASFRFVVDWGTGHADGVYPGGQSENPASPWYATGIGDWRAGRMRPVIEGDQATAATKGRTWTLTP